jgi:hypothetical protein
MNECRHNSRIHLLVEGELDPRKAAELKEHLETCASCFAQFEMLRGMKNLIEAARAAKVPYHDTDADMIRKASSGVHEKRFPKKRLVRGFLLVTAASLAAFFVGSYLFLHVHFQKTFSYQLHGTIARCSNGIEISESGNEWRKLQPGDHLIKGALIKTPQASDSFLAFDQMRLLMKDETHIQFEGHRTLAVQGGELFLAIARAESRATIVMNGIVLQTNGGSFKINRTSEGIKIAVTGGTVSVEEQDGKKQQLSQNQAGTFHDGTFKIARSEVKNPFDQLKISVIDRIKARFAKIISKYSAVARMRPPRSRFLTYLENPEGMLRLASYFPDENMNWNEPSGSNEAPLSDYYESLFIPSNRTISLGRQKLVPLGRGKAASLPAWSHDGSMIAYIEYTPLWSPAVVKVARLDDLDNPWTVSQEIDWVGPMFPVVWTPDDRHLIFQSDLTALGDVTGGNGFEIKIAPVDPAEGPLRDFKSPFPDIPFQLPIPIGGTISPCIESLPWGDAVLCANWGNIGYIPIDPDGTPVPTSPGIYLTNFNPRETFVVGVHWAPSGNKLVFMGVSHIGITRTEYDSVNVYILYDVEDILDGFTQPPRSIDDPRIKCVSPTKNTQYTGGFSFDESLVFYQEDVNNLWKGRYPTDFSAADFDLFYANALPDQPSKPAQIHLPGSQMFLRPSPEGNRLAYCNFDGDKNELRLISFGVEADMDMDLGGVIIDNSGTNLIVPPGALENNFKVTISTPLSIEDEAEIQAGESHFFAMRLLDAKGLENPKFIEPMTLTIRYTNDEVAGLDEGMLDIYYYDETDPDHPKWVGLGGTVDPEHNEITVEIKHFSKYAIGEEARDSASAEINGERYKKIFKEGGKALN